MKFNFKYYLFTIIISLIIVFIYFSSRYEFIDHRIRSIEITAKMTSRLSNTYLYFAKSTDIDFKNAYPFEKISDSVYIANFDFEFKIRKFRIYFHDSTRNYFISRISIQNEKSISLSKFKTGNNLWLDKKGKIKSLSGNGYIESPYYFYKSDINSIGYIIIFLLVISAFITPYLHAVIYELKRNSIVSLSIAAFVISIYLPHPIFNIFFILSLIIVIKNFDFNFFKSKKINLILIMFFLLLFINDLLISKESYTDLSATETYLPFLFLPVYVSCITDDDSLRYFPISAIIIGYTLVMTSALDAAILKNIELVSFDYFTKYLNPIYYSYLVAFSIFYIKLKGKEENKIYVTGVLFILLFLSGSKLVILITILLYLMFSTKMIVKLDIIVSFLSIVLLFSPIRDRYLNIMAPEDLSIVKEKHIVDSNDARINGLTFRLILWKEAISAANTLKFMMFGNGVGPSSREKFEKRIVDRGLSNHGHFMPHNQFIETFFKNGLLGLIMLFFVLAHCLRIAIKTNNKLLLIVIIILIFAMLSESVFERARGIYFFITVILLLMNTPPYEKSKILSFGRTNT